MSELSVGRRRFLQVTGGLGLSALSALAVGATLGVAGCATSTTAAGPTVAPAPGAGFPVTIPGVEGPTTIPAAPVRVVSVGTYRDTDAAVGLGVVPLLTPDLSTFIPTGISPWVRARLTGTDPTLMQVTDGLPLEQITQARPDLVLGTDYSALDEDYALLSRIAPTLSLEAGYNKDTWQVTTTRVGQALGRTAEAAALVAQTEKLVADTRAANPGLAGRTFTIGPVQADGSVTTISSDTDASARFLSELGMTLSPAVTSLPPGNFPGRATVSPEALNTLDADVLILTYNTPAARERLEATELFRRIPAVQRGAYVPLDLTTAIAIAFPSALSIPYALDQSVAKIAAASAR